MGLGFGKAQLTEDFPDWQCEVQEQLYFTFVLFSHLQSRIKSFLHYGKIKFIRGPFGKFEDWQQCAAVM
jgi:hypothetical protein